MPTFPRLSGPARLLRDLVRTLAYALVAAAALVCLLLLAVRFYLFPRIDEFRPHIGAAMSRAIGQQVEVDRVSPAWDGWNPRLVLAGLRVRDSAGKVVLVLPTVDSVLSWRWMLVGQLRMKTLTIDEPSLVVRRDPQGVLHVAGAQIDTEASGGDTRLGEWLLRQRAVAIRNGSLTWIDEYRRAPPVSLDRVEFRLENGVTGHRFGLSGVPPKALASPIDLRGELRGDVFRSRDSLRGSLYLRLDYADLAAWRQWLPIPVDVRAGTGGLRLWMTIAGGAISASSGDFDLAGVRVQIQSDRPPLAFAGLSGRVAVKEQGGRREIRFDSLSVRATNRASPTPVAGFVHVPLGEAERGSRGELRVGEVELAAVGGVLRALPLPASVADALEAHAPSGTLEQGELRWESRDPKLPARYAVKGIVRDARISGRGAVPTLSRLTGAFEATEKSGKVDLAAAGGRLDLAALHDPLVFDSAAVRASWDVRNDGLGIRIERLALANADAAGSLSGEYRSTSAGPGWVELDATLSRADPLQVWRYLPRVVHDGIRQWLRTAIVAGSASGTRLRLKGDLARFPFADGQGEFRVELKGEAAELHYADGWPNITGIRADVVFDGAGMRITGHEGRILGTVLGRVDVTIPSFRAYHPLLLIAGTASGPTAEFLRVVDASPVAGRIERFTDGISATGDGRLALKLDIPLGDEAATRVSGEYGFESNTVRMGADVPPVESLSGVLAFTERDIAAPELSAQVLGGPARITVAHRDGKIAITASGNVALAPAMQALSVPGAERISGRSDWQIAIDSGAEAPPAWTLELPMKGAAIDLPPPFGKPADSTAPVRVERRALASGRESTVVTFGDPDRRSGQLKLVRGPTTRTGRAVESALLLLGRASGEPQAPGLWVRGDVDELDADRWRVALAGPALAAASSTTAAAPGASPGTPAGASASVSSTATATATTAVPAAAHLAGMDLGGIDLRVRKLRLLGRDTHDVTLKAIGGKAWKVDVASREIDGRIDWRPDAADSGGNGQLTARLAKLHLGDAEDTDSATASARASQAAAVDTADPRHWPVIDLSADALISSGRTLGRLELRGRPRGADWRIERLRVASPEGDLAVEGWWRGGPPQRTDVDVTLAVKDTPGFLRRHGYPDAVRGAATRITGKLSWPGGLHRFDYATLDGTIGIDTKAGQFTKMEPGLGKLLGVLNLQALPRRMTFDFRDVFSEGFAFDALAGTVRIARGMMSTADLRFAGPSARVEISGQANLVEETQNLDVKVLPSLATSVAVGAAVGLANPAIGAAVLLGQKILRDPVDRLFATQYRVTGGWADPQVERVSAVSDPRADTP